VDARSDLYSTGCLMYELLTGRPPFTGDSPVAIAYQHVRENPIPPSRLDPSLPPWADSIVLKAMAKSTSDRYQSAAEMQADIQRAASGMQVAAAMPPQTRLDYYGDYPQRTQQMGPQTSMGAAPTTMSPYQQSGYQTGYQQPYGYGNGGTGGGDIEQRGGGRRWIGWIIAGVVVVAAIIVAVILMNGGSGSSVNVPLVNGESWTQAKAQIEAAGLNPVEAQQASTSVKSGTVISTNPDNGNSVAKGSTVTVTVSSGTAAISLPNVVGEQYSAAQTQLQNAGFTNVTAVADATSTEPSGQVTKMTPTPGSYQANQQITLTYSGGNTPVPNVVNQTAAEAASILEHDGFTVETNVIAASADQMVQPGTVYNQNPVAGQAEPKGSQIQIFVEPTTTSSSTPTPTDTGTPTDTPTATPTDTPTATPTDTGTTGGIFGGLATEGTGKNS
jgi:serine/threonine-protein kinase